MSEWGIEQPSSFGDAGGCFVEGLSLVGGVALIVIMLCVVPKERAHDNQSQPKREFIKQDTIVNNMTDTIAFVTKNACQR